MLAITRKLKYCSSTPKYFIDTTLKNFTAEAYEPHPTSLDFISQTLSKLGINITSLTAHPSQSSIRGHSPSLIMLSVCSQHQSQVKNNIPDLQTSGIFLKEGPPIVVPWFPQNKKDLDKIGKNLIQLDQSQDHPQFQDKQYRIRRDAIANISKQFKMGDQIPTVNYTPEQHQLWRYLYNKLKPLHQLSMSKRFLKYQAELQKEVNISERIPQLKELSAYLEEKTNFTIKPVHGILSQREFLNALAFKVFCSTQYLRHVSHPEYTPQPDIVHQFMGHVPTFADPDIASISQNIGLLSLGASDQQISKLSALYWYTMEFGVCKEEGELKAYGAGIAGCVQEIQYFLGRRESKPKIEPFDMLQDCFITDYPLQNVQPVYKVTENFERALQDLQRYRTIIDKPLKTTYDPLSESIIYDCCIEAIETQDKGPTF